ncbi:hypothetical protein HpMS107_14060 [Helicobacter pylori]
MRLGQTIPRLSGSTADRMCNAPPLPYEPGMEAYPPHKPEIESTAWELLDLTGTRSIQESAAFSASKCNPLGKRVSDFLQCSMDFYIPVKLDIRQLVA